MGDGRELITVKETPAVNVAEVTFAHTNDGENSLGLKQPCEIVGIYVKYKMSVTAGNRWLRFQAEHASDKWIWYTAGNANTNKLVAEQEGSLTLFHEQKNSNGTAAELPYEIHLYGGPNNLFLSPFASLEVSLLNNQAGDHIEEVVFHLAYN